MIGAADRLSGEHARLLPDFDDPTYELEGSARAVTPSDQRG
jgi:hypothetical protein